MIVIDASYVVEAILKNRRRGAEAREVLKSEREVAVPDTFDAEVVSALRGMWLGGKVDAEEFAQAMDDLCDLPAERYQSRDLVGRAFELRSNVSPYDACYVHLAELLDVPLYTGDRKLSRAPGLRCEVRVLGEVA